MTFSKKRPGIIVADTPFKRLLRIKDALRTADTPEKQAAMEDIIKQYSKQLGHTKKEYIEFRDTVLRKYPFPPIKKEFLQ